jgi:hypothetical protein
MMRISSFPFLTLFIALSMLGCADDEQLVTIEGALSLDLGYAETGFEFEANTPVVAEAHQATPGCAAGGCTITLDENCDPAGFDLWLERGTDGEQGNGFRLFALTIGAEETLVSASVADDEGDVVYSSVGVAQCVVSDLSEVNAEGDATVVIDCGLESSEGNEAYALADLSLTGCTVE